MSAAAPMARGVHVLVAPTFHEELHTVRRDGREVHLSLSVRALSGADAVAETTQQIGRALTWLEYNMGHQYGVTMRGPTGPKPPLLHSRLEGFVLCAAVFDAPSVTKAKALEARLLADLAEQYPDVPVEDFLMGGDVAEVPENTLVRRHPDVVNKLKGLIDLVGFQPGYLAHIAADGTITYPQDA